MALNRKYAALPDLDLAPDIYETPELTDDNSTVPTTAARSQSDDEFDSTGDDVEGISRSRIRIDAARSRFLPSNVKAGKADLSGRIDGKRKSYRASIRRQRMLENEMEELKDLSDDEDEENLDMKIARLKREIEEAREAFAKRENASKTQEAAVETVDDGLQSLSKLLDDISRQSGFDYSSADRKLYTTTPAPGNGEMNETSSQDGPTYTITYAPAYEKSHALAKAASFDQRLLLLERGLGIGQSSILETDENGRPRAVLPTLDMMEKQVSMLAQASTSSLDAISRRVRALASEQDKLNDSREKAKAVREELDRHGTTSETVDSEQESRVNALYGTLPTIERLTPMLAPLLDRLRSLRTIHADAAMASQTLERIEQQQATLAGELKQWRAGIEELEGALKQSNGVVKANVDVMEGWVRDLEQRMTKFI